MRLITKNHLCLMKLRKSLDPKESHVFTIEGTGLSEALWKTYLGDDSGRGSIDIETYDTYFSYLHYPIPWPLRKA